MKYLRYLYENKIYYGKLDGKKVREIDGDIFGDFKSKNKEIDLKKVKILPPSNPTKIVSVGLNYTDHAKELDMDIPDDPIIFLKPSSSVIGHLDHIIYPKMSNRLDYEAELAIIIKNKIKSISEDEVGENILGYTCFNDVTARDLQNKDIQWSRAKSFDTFSPIGPYIVDNINPNNLKIESFLNGKKRQSSNTNNFIFRVEYLVSFISEIMTLYPGDVITTGTPAGVGPINVGDTVQIKIESIGTLQNEVFGD